jgi:YfiH family protein
MHALAPELLPAEWPAPPGVHVATTTRRGGMSRGPYASLNLGAHVGDDPGHVARNRALVRARLPGDPYWLEQVHGTAVAEPGRDLGVPLADAAVTRSPGVVLAAMTADCLPVAFAVEDGSAIAIAHAGWRGLAAGVLEATVARLAVAPERLLAHLGPAIGAAWYEVGDEVREAFVARDPQASAAFHAAGPAKWYADLYALARRRLAALGLVRVHGGEHCTFTDHARFFSFRRDGVTGRMATLVWIARPGA